MNDEVVQDFPSRCWQTIRNFQAVLLVIPEDVSELLPKIPSCQPRVASKVEVEVEI